MRTVQKLLWLFLFCCVAVASGDAAPDRDGDRVISGVGVVAPDGSICHGMAVVVNAEGQVSGVIPADQADPALIDLIAPEGSVITPGLHDLLGALGATGALTAGTLLLDPDLRAADAFDSTDPHLEDAAAHGILHTTIAAVPRGLLNGNTATFLCQGGAPGAQLGEGKPYYALAETALDSSREPTSRVAMVASWKDWLATSDKSEQVPGILYCPDAIDLRQTLDIGWSELPVMVHSGDARSPVERLAGRDALLIVGPFLEGGDAAQVRTAVRAAQAGVELAFSGGLPLLPADHLRRSAAIAVAAGLDAEAARRALFSNPARACGVSSIGIIEPGARADLVLFSTDPLDPAAKVIQIWRGGQRTRVATPPGVISDLEVPR